MSNLIVAGTIWLATHLGISGTASREILIKQFGYRGYLTIYSMIAIASLSYFIFSFSQINTAEHLWIPNTILRLTALLLTPIALVLLVGSFMTANPTIVGQNHKLADLGKGAGVIRITRHPFQWATIIWAISHIISTGTFEALVFFGAFAVVSFIGTFLMDKRKLSRDAEHYGSYLKVTSNVPFVAILQGRNHLFVKELAGAIVLGLILYFILLWLHVDILY